MKKKKREFRCPSQKGWSLKLRASYKYSLKFVMDTNKTCNLIYWGFCPHEGEKIKQGALPLHSLALLSEDTDRPERMDPMGLGKFPRFTLRPTQVSEGGLMCCRANECHT